MFDITLKTLLDKEVEALQQIKESLCETYYDEETTQQYVSIAAVTSALTQVDYWCDYFSNVREISNSKVEKLNIENAQLKAENKLLKNKVSDLIEKNNKCHGKIGTLQSKVEYLSEVIKAKDNSSSMVSVDLVEKLDSLDEAIKIIKDKAKDNSSSMVSVNLVKKLDSLDEAIKLIEDNAKTLAYKGNVKAFKPAKRVDISDKDIKTKYEAGETAYKIAKDCGLTAGAIVYRLKQMGIYKGKE
jgi:molecular chaperone GrpE (heat shock protein)